MKLAPADFSLRAVVGDTLRALAVRAHKKGLELISQVQPDVPDALVGDAGRLRQVLLNLVGNAIKFTDAGEVVVRVETPGDAAGPAPGAGDIGLRFTVRDTGMGIPPDQQCAFGKRARPEDAARAWVVGPCRSRRACRFATRGALPTARQPSPISRSPSGRR
jgi:K+-sensing histidine kinase KdpD